MNWKIIQVIYLIISLTLPIAFIINYEDYVLQNQDTSHISQLLLRKAVELQHLQSQNKKSYQQLKNRIITTRQQQNQWIEQIQNIKVPSNAVLRGEYFEANYLINILISPGFMYQQLSIRQETMWQLEWLKRQFNMNMSIIIWQKDIDLSRLKNSIIIIFRQLRYEYMQQNIAIKLKKGQYRNIFYLKEIVKQFKMLPIFSNCRFMNRHCQQVFILFIHHHNHKQQTYWQVDRQFYFIDQYDSTLIFNVLVSVLEMQGLVKLKEQQVGQAADLYRILINKGRLQSARSVLGYIQFILTKKQLNISQLQQKLIKNVDEAIKYLKNGEFITPYYHNSQEIHILLQYLNNCFVEDNNISYIQNSFITHSILTNNQIGLIDIFPSDFKIGVYLPLYVLILYPLLLKIKQLVVYIFKSLKRRFHLKNQ